MKTKTQFLTIAAFLGLAGPLSGQVWFSDSFSGSTLDAARWVTNRPYSDSYVRQTSGYVEVEDAGRITTVTSFSGVIEVTGRLQLSNNTRSNCNILLRSDGNQVANAARGVHFQFSCLLDTGSATRQLGIFAVAASPISTNLLVRKPETTIHPPPLL